MKGWLPTPLDASKTARSERREGLRRHEGPRQQELLWEEHGLIVTAPFQIICHFMFWYKSYHYWKRKCSYRFKTNRQGNYTIFCRGLETDREILRRTDTEIVSRHRQKNFLSLSPLLCWYFFVDELISLSVFRITQSVLHRHGNSSF